MRAVTCWAPSMTWSLVTTRPSDETTNPEPVAWPSWLAALMNATDGCALSYTRRAVVSSTTLRVVLGAAVVAAGWVGAELPSRTICAMPAPPKAARTPAAPKAAILWRGMEGLCDRVLASASRAPKVRIRTGRERRQGPPGQRPRHGSLPRPPTRPRHGRLVRDRPRARPPVCRQRLRPRDHRRGRRARAGRHRPPGPRGHRGGGPGRPLPCRRR